MTNINGILIGIFIYNPNNNMAFIGQSDEKYHGQIAKRVLNQSEYSSLKHRFENSDYKENEDHGPINFLMRLDENKDLKVQSWKRGAYCYQNQKLEAVFKDLRDKLVSVTDDKIINAILEAVKTNQNENTNRDDNSNPRDEIEI